MFGNIHNTPKNRPTKLTKFLLKHGKEVIHNAHKTIYTCLFYMLPTIYLTNDDHPNLVTRYLLGNAHP